MRCIVRRRVVQLVGVAFNRRGGTGLHLGRLPFLHNCLGILGRLAALRGELLDHCLVAALGFEAHASPLPLQALNFDLIVSKLVLRVRLDVRCLFLRHHFEELPVFNVDGEPLWDEEAEPLQRLLVEPTVGKGVLPVRDTEVHDHDAEVVREGVGDVIPLAGEVLEPNLRFLLGPFEQKSDAAVLRLGVDLKRNDLFHLVALVLIVRRLHVALADAPELEVLTLDLLDVSELVQMHVAKRDHLVTALDAPC